MKMGFLDHFVLTVRDLPAAIDFYTRVLGMEVITFGNGRKALRFGQQKINLHEQGRQLYPPVARNPVPGSADFCLITPDPLPAVIRHLEEHGVPIVAGPVEKSGARGAILSVYIHDPDGNMVEISNYL